MDFSTLTLLARCRLLRAHWISKVRRRIAAIADRAQPGVSDAGVLGRHTAEPGGKLPAVPKVGRNPQRGHHRVGDDRSDADDRAQTETGRIISRV